MVKFNIGDKVRIKDRQDWPTPPGYRLANSEGTITKIWEQDVPQGEIFQEYVQVKIEKTECKELDISHTYNFRQENIELIKEFI